MRQLSGVHTVNYTVNIQYNCIYITSVGRKEAVGLALFDSLYICSQSQSLGLI